MCPRALPRHTEVTVRIPTVDHETLRDLASGYGCSVPEVIRRAISLYILTQERVERYGDVWPGDEVPETEDGS